MGFPNISKRPMLTPRRQPGGPILDAAIMLPRTTSSRVLSRVNSIAVAAAYFVEVLLQGLA